MEAILRKQLAIKEYQLKQFRKMNENGASKSSEFNGQEGNIIGEIECLRGLLISTKREHGRRRK